jgi:hypothetical protein
MVSASVGAMVTLPVGCRGQQKPKRRCRQVAMTLHQTVEPDGTGWKPAGFSFVRDSKEVSVKVAFRNGFLLGAKTDSIPGARFVD